ncbi:hypothetical protein ABBQ38_013947 [Trebouxia sp. C0009 RCD-2024]
MRMDAAVEQFRSGTSTFQQQLEALIQSVTAERAQLAESTEKLKAEREAYEQEKHRVSQVFSGNEQVVLNVGGVKFTTTQLTLQNAPAPSLFAAMFSGRHTLKADQNGHYFIDRDGRHFHDILNYLRDGMLNYPPDGSDHKYLLELRAEAEYYGLTGLVEQIDRYPYGMMRAQRTSCLNTDDSWMYEDGHDEIVFSVAKACQLLGIGLCGTEGAYTAEVELLEVDPADMSQQVAKVQDAAQSYTKADGEIVRLMLQKPALLLPKKCYMISALIKGAESFCCEECLATVVAAGVRIHFHNWESPNGTTDNRGQFPELYIRAV